MERLNRLLADNCSKTPGFFQGTIFNNSSEIRRRIVFMGVLSVLMVHKSKRCISLRCVEMWSGARRYYFYSMKLAITGKSVLVYFGELGNTVCMCRWYRWNGC